MTDKIVDLINLLKERQKSLASDQRTDDAMDPREFKGYDRAMDEVISLLESSL